MYSTDAEITPLFIRIILAVVLSPAYAVSFIMTATTPAPQPCGITDCDCHLVTS